MHWPSLPQSGRNETESYSSTHILCYFSTIKDTLNLCSGNTATDTTTVMSVQNLFLLTVLTCNRGTAVAQWLRCCATNRKVAGSIPDGVIGIFH